MHLISEPVTIQCIFYKRHEIHSMENSNQNKNVENNQQFTCNFYRWLSFWFALIFSFGCHFLVELNFLPCCFFYFIHFRQIDGPSSFNFMCFFANIFFIVQFLLGWESNKEINYNWFSVVVLEVYGRDSACNWKKTFRAAQSFERDDI